MKRTWMMAVLAALLVAAPVAPVSAQYQDQGTTAQDQTGTTGTVDATTDAETSTDTDETLPATASPLPLVALAGVIALGAGIWLSRRKAA